MPDLHNLQHSLALRCLQLDFLRTRLAFAGGAQ